MVDSAGVKISSETLWTASADGLLVVDDEGSIRATNPALDRLFGYPENSLIGRSVECLVPAENRHAHLDLRRGYEDAPTTRPMGASQHLEGLRADDTTFPVNVSLAKVDTDHGAMTVAAIRDLTARVGSEAAAALANRHRALAEDHDRIASELHDNTIQRLFALGLGLQGLPDRIEGPDVAQQVHAAVDTIDDIIRDIRSTIYGLRHHIDPPEGLRRRAISVVSEMEATLGFAPELHFFGPVDEVTDESIIGHLLPVIREGLANMARHAGASQGIVNLRVDDHVTVEVIDDGIGIRPDVVRSGLANMADRALSLDGSFLIERGEASGTVLRWKVPSENDLDDDSADDDAPKE